MADFHRNLYGSKMIALTKGYSALVDDEELEELSVHQWFAIQHRSGHVYAARNSGRRADGKYRHLYMHRVLMCAPSNLQVDHINGDGLDNRRSNLRLATFAQQRRNCVGQPGRRKSRFKGVMWMADSTYRAGGRWRYSLMREGTVFRGYAKTEEAAAAHYDELARQHHGEFARTNGR